MFEDFKKHKLKYLSYIFLIIIILSMQTYISFLKNNIEDLEYKINSSSHIVSSSITNDNDDSEKSNIDTIEFQNDNRTKGIKEMFIDFAKKENKQYDSTINGKEVFKFECFDLSKITDGQIKNGISKLTKNNFNITIEMLSMSNKIYYKIKLYE